MRFNGTAMAPWTDSPASFPQAGGAGGGTLRLAVLAAVGSASSIANAGTSARTSSSSTTGLGV